MSHFTDSVEGMLPEPGAIDIEAFTSPKTNRFKFPKFPQRPEDRVKIKDVTDYKEMWEEFEAWEKRSFTIADFFFHLEGAFLEFEIETFEGFVRPKNKDLLQEINVLRLVPLEEILYDQLSENPEGEPVWLPSSKRGLKSAISEGYLARDENVTTAEVWNCVKVSELKPIATKGGITLEGLKKTEIVEALVNAEIPFPKNIDLPYQPTSLLLDLIREAIGVYVDAVKSAANRFPPFYAPYILEFVTDDGDYDAVALRVAEVASTKYWLEMMEERSSKSPLAKLPPGSQEQSGRGGSAGSSGCLGCALPAVFSVMLLAWSLIF